MAVAGAARLALDEDVRPLLAELLRDRGCDAVSVHDAERTGRPDAEQLAWATSEQRVLVSHNAADFARLAADWSRAGREHRGMLLLRQGPVGWHLREVLRALAAHPRGEDWVDRVVWGAPPPGA